MRVEVYHMILALDPGLDCHAVHRELWRSFPGHPRGRTRPFLWCRDGRYVAVRSTEEPTPPDDTDVVRLRRDSIEVEAGHTYRFAMTCDPVVTKKQSAGPSKRRSLTRCGDIFEWLERRGQASGFELVSLVVLSTGTERWSHGAKRGIHGSAELSGRLEVTDEERLAEALVGGIGPAKAFGFGLLWIGEECHGAAKSYRPSPA
jgi:CRISPR-associated protein Cas6/Cse3/CasE subtype I-E